VQAVLRVHPFRAPIVFDTRIDADTASVTVHDADA
jgi:predicted component of type VI protein secretion system